MNDADIRFVIYEHLANHGRAPSFEQLRSLVGDHGETVAALRRLHDGHALVLGGDGQTIEMALPFAAHPTDHVVIGTDRRWWANCAWDSLAIPTALDTDATIAARWLDDESPVDFAVTDGALSTSEGFVHFAIPARHWWDDIVET